MPDNLSDLGNFIERESEGIVNDLVDFLKIKTISPDKKSELQMAEGADSLEKQLKEIGLQAKQIKNIGKGHPVVYAETKNFDPEKATVIIYGHYDVQPQGPDEIWKTDSNDAFIPKVDRDADRIYARGAADNKGQIFATKFAVKYLLEKGDLPVNLRLVYEGNEEMHNAAFDDWIEKQCKEKTGLLHGADLAIVLDAQTVLNKVPTITTSLRGAVVARLEASSIDKLIEILHKSHDQKKNRITIGENFYANIKEQTVPNSVLKELPVFGKRKTGKVILPTSGYSAYDNNWFLPSNSPVGVRYLNKDEGKLDGIISFNIETYGPSEKIHSGQFGGPVIEPALLMAHVISALKEKYTVEIDYMNYGLIEELSTSIYPKAIAQITIIDGLEKDGAAETIENEKTRILEEIFGESDKNIQNLAKFDNLNISRNEYLEDEPFVKGFGKNAEKAMTNLTYRIVADQKPGEIYDSVMKFAKDIDPKIREFEKEIFFHPFGTDISNEYIQAMSDGFVIAYRNRLDYKEKMQFKGNGASVPVSSAFQKGGITTVVTGFAPADCNMHGQDESYMIKGSLEVGAESLIRALYKIEEMHKSK